MTVGEAGGLQKGGRSLQNCDISALAGRNETSLFRANFNETVLAAQKIACGAFQRQTRCARPRARQPARRDFATPLATISDGPQGRQVSGRRREGQRARE